jgi:hypothetical protein
MMTAFKMYQDQMNQDQMPEAKGKWVYADDVINPSPTKTETFIQGDLVRY